MTNKPSDISPPVLNSELKSLLEDLQKHIVKKRQWEDEHHPANFPQICQQMIKRDYWTLKEGLNMLCYHRPECRLWDHGIAQLWTLAKHCIGPEGSLRVSNPEVQTLIDSSRAHKLIVRPQDLLGWAQSKQVPVPPELIEAMTGRPALPSVLDESQAPPQKYLENRKSSQEELLENFREFQNRRPDESPALTQEFPENRESFRKERPENFREFQNQSPDESRAPTQEFPKNQKSLREQHPENFREFQNQSPDESRAPTEKATEKRKSAREERLEKLREFRNRIDALARDYNWNSEIMPVTKADTLTQFKKLYPTLQHVSLDQFGDDAKEVGFKFKPGTKTNPDNILSRLLQQCQKK